MLRSFLGWLDDYLAGETPPAILRAVVGLLSFAVLLGALLGSVAVKAGVLVAALLALAGLALLALTDRRSLHHKYEAHRRLVSHYCDLIHQAPQITNWRQVTVIDEHGNAKETVVVHAKTVHDDIHFFRAQDRTGLGSAGEVPAEGQGQRAQPFRWRRAWHQHGDHVILAGQRQARRARALPHIAESR
jgi:hypothetical protein